MDLSYPGLRTNILAELESLADTAYQQRAWLGGIYPPDTWDDLTLAMEVLLGDTPVCREPEDWVGLCIYPDEVEPWRALGIRLIAMLDDLGDVKDEVYLSDARWRGVVDAAAATLRVVRANDARARHAPDRDENRGREPR